MLIRQGLALSTPAFSGVNMNRFNPDHCPQQRMTDGQAEFSLSHLPLLFERLDQWFDKHGIPWGLNSHHPFIFLS